MRVVLMMMMMLSSSAFAQEIAGPRESGVLLALNETLAFPSAARTPMERRQLALAAVGCGLALVAASLTTPRWRRLSLPLVAMAACVGLVLLSRTGEPLRVSRGVVHLETPAGNFTDVWHLYHVRHAAAISTLSLPGSVLVLAGSPHRFESLSPRFDGDQQKITLRPDATFATLERTRDPQPAGEAYMPTFARRVYASPGYTMSLRDGCVVVRFVGASP